MDLFGRKMDREGIQTLGTIERVVVTEERTGGDGPLWGDEQSTVVYLTVRFTDQEGVVHTQEVKTTFRPEHIPPPSGEIELRYMPKDPSKLHTYGTGPVDPSVPRGWGAGIFEVEDLGGHHAKSLFAGHGIDEQRELFRTGQRAQATVVSVTCHPHIERRSAHEYSLTLRAGGQEIETRAWAPLRCVPQPGDLIEIAVSADGSDVALDTDERYDGPPGRALVFTTPAPSPEDVSAKDAAQPGAASAGAGRNPAVVSLFEQIAGMKQARRQMGRHYEKTIRAQLDGQRRAGVIDDATYDQLLQEALSDQ